MEASLVIVPTPIGNLKDITLRAIEVLKEVDFVLAEDTRTSGNLLRHLEIERPLKSFHIHNEHKVLEGIIDQLKEGKRAALVSDAGTPAISDPGYLLVRECLRHDLEVECLPGPTALIPALVKSGFPTDRFIFEGFLPHKKGRQSRILEFKEEERTVVLYESPHRLTKLLLQLEELLGESRWVSVSRELSKIYEETVTDEIKEVKEHFGDSKIKGEIVVIIAGNGFKG